MGRPEGTRLDYFSWAQQDSITPRRGMRRPSLVSKVSTASKPASRGDYRTRALDLPTLNLAKVRRSLEQQEEASTGQDDPVEPTGTQSTPASARGDRRTSLLKRTDYHPETARLNDSREKLVKYTYPYTVAQLMNMTSNGSLERRLQGDSYAVKHSRQVAESKAETESMKTKKSDSNFQAKKLSLCLVNSLEEALAKVSKPDWESRKFLAKEPFPVAARLGHLNYLSMKDDKHGQEDRTYDERVASGGKDSYGRLKLFKPAELNSSSIPLVWDCRIWWESR